MGILELLLAILLFLFVVNLFLAVIPVPRGIGGAIVIILVVILAWRLVFGYV